MESYITTKKFYTIKSNQNSMILCRGYSDYWKATGKSTYSEEEYIGTDYSVYQQHYPVYASTVFSWILMLAGLNQKQFDPHYREYLTNLYMMPNGKVTLVYYSQDTYGKDILTEDVKRFISLLDGLFMKGHVNIANAIFVSTNPAHYSAAEYLTKNLPLYHIQHFYDREFEHNPIKHYLVPKHEALSEEETKTILEKNYATLKQFPQLLTSDAIAKYYDFLPGMLIKITRKSPYSGVVVETCITYRAVSDPPPLDKKQSKTRTKEKSERNR